MNAEAEAGGVGSSTPGAQEGSADGHSGDLCSRPQTAQWEWERSAQDTYLPPNGHLVQGSRLRPAPKTPLKLSHLSPQLRHLQVQLVHLTGELVLDGVRVQGPL